MTFKHLVILTIVVVAMVVPLSSRADVPPPPEIIDVQQIEQTACVIFCSPADTIQIDRTSNGKGEVVCEHNFVSSEAVGQAGNWGYSIFVMPDPCVPVGHAVYKLSDLYDDFSSASIGITESPFDCALQYPNLCRQIQVPPAEDYCFREGGDDVDYDDTGDDTGTETDDTVRNLSTKAGGPADVDFNYECFNDTDNDTAADDTADDDNHFGDDANASNNTAGGSDKKSCGGCSTAEDSGAGSLALAVGMFIAGLVFVKVTGRKKR